MQLGKTRPPLAMLALVLATTLNTGCRSPDGAGPAPQASQPSQATGPGDPLAWPLAAPAEAERHGAWRGGPEPVSGKLPTGIAVYYRLSQPDPSDPRLFQVVLRTEGVTDEDGSLQLGTVDGAQFTPSTATRAWRLQPHSASQVQVQVRAAATGDSYLHVLTRQRGRVASRSLLLAQPASKDTPLTAKPTTGPQAEPLIRMQSAP